MADDDEEEEEPFLVFSSCFKVKTGNFMFFSEALSEPSKKKNNNKNKNEKEKEKESKALCSFSLSALFESDNRRRMLKKRLRFL